MAFLIVLAQRSAFHHKPQRSALFLGSLAGGAKHALIDVVALLVV